MIRTDQMSLWDSLMQWHRELKADYLMWLHIQIVHIETIEREYADKLITAVKKSNYPIRLEYNYASRIEPGYFKEEFWEEVPKDLVIFGYDAHSPEEIVNGWNYYKDLTSHKKRL